MPAHRIDVKQRLLKNRDIDPTTGCWLWTKSCGKKGYGQIWIIDKFVRVSRASFEIFKGPIPDGLNVLHSCDTPRCFNPDHLEAGTQSKNITDAVERGRWPASGPRTMCRNGHPKPEAGLCEICRVANYQRWYAANREQVLIQRRKRDRRKCKTTATELAA